MLYTVSPLYISRTSSWSTHPIGHFGHVTTYSLLAAVPPSSVMVHAPLRLELHECGTNFPTAFGFAQTVQLLRRISKLSILKVLLIVDFCYLF
jgi:hypothetical protein